MVTDFETNTIYFSKLITTDNRFKSTFEQIAKVLDSYGIKPRLIPDTNDIWARDYMPIQVSDDKYIEYRYDPDYLQGHWKGFRNLKTYPDIVCESLNRKTKKSKLILDGGNVIKSTNCIIITDKIIKENRNSFTKETLLKELHELFQVDKVVLIPWDKKEKYGHADGMLRFINNETVLINQIYRKDNVLLYRLEQCGLKYEFLDFKVKKKDKRQWAYINFLQTRDLILIPKFGVDEDEQALTQIEEYFADYKERKMITQVDMTKIVKSGGALNCISWTTKE